MTGPGAARPVGFVGLGVMGSRMAGRLLTGQCGVIAYDANPSAMAELAEQGATSASDLAQLAARCEVVLCSLPSPQALETVAEGLVSGGKGALRTVVDLSTTGPTVSRALADRLSGVGITLVDCPVSGGSSAAEVGGLTLMASGPRPAFDEVEPLLGLIGKSIFYVGQEPGLAQTMKLVNNLLFAANALSAFEVLTFGVKAGLDARTMLDVINVSSGRSYITTDRIPQTVLDRSFPNRFATALMQKDVKLGLDAAESFGSPLHMLHAVNSFLAFAMSQGDGPRDCAELIKHFEGWAGVTVGEAV